MPSPFPCCPESWMLVKENRDRKKNGGNGKLNMKWQKSSYFLTHNNNIADSQSHVAPIMVTSINEKSTSAKILPSTVEDEITLSLPAMLRILIVIAQGHKTLLTVDAKR